MDFDDTAAEAAFRAEARGWLEDHASYRTGEERTGLARASDDGHVDRCKAWQHTLYDGGWAGITWPKEYGGRGGTPNEARIFNEEQARFDVATGVFVVSTAMVGPTLIAHGTEAQKERYLDPMLQGDEVWCQLFSEPGAGSDLAGLRTQAVADGDEFVVNGQKVWTSGAQHSDWGILLTRTDPSVPKHRGISYFVVDMASEGIDVRPLRQITGHAHFNEVFLSDVRIPAENLVGDVDQGWGPILTTLANERTAISGGTSNGTWDQLLDLARQFDRTDDPRVRQHLAAAYTRYQLLTYVSYRVQTAMSHGQMPGPESSTMKLSFSGHAQEIGNLFLEIEGAEGLLAEPDAPVSGLAQSLFLGQWSMRIGGGTDQIQRNVIGERVLGLPREPRLDKGVPFTDVPAG